MDTRLTHENWKSKHVLDRIMFIFRFSFHTVVTDCNCWDVSFMKPLNTFNTPEVESHLRNNSQVVKIFQISQLFR